MIRMHNLPEHIKSSLNKHLTKREKPDVFPSKFLIDDTLYYYFAFAPSAEQLIIRDDGSVPYFDEVKKEALICQNYNSSIELIISIGREWVTSRTIQNYEKLEKILKQIKEKLPEELNGAYKNYLNCANTIIYNQKVIEDCVRKATEIWERTNAKEIATEDDQKEMRVYIVDIATAGYHQNAIQMDTEKERDEIWKYVSSHIFQVGPLLYFKLRTYQKNMMNNTKENMIEKKRIGDMVLGGDLPLEQHEHAPTVWNRLRNPRRY